MKRGNDRLEESYRGQSDFEKKYFDGLTRMMPKIDKSLSENGSTLVLVSSVSPMGIHEPTNELTWTWPGMREQTLIEQGLPYLFIRMDLVGIRKAANKTKAKNEIRKKLRLPDPHDRIVVPVRGTGEPIGPTKDFRGVEKDIRRTIAPLGFNGQIGILSADEYWYDIVLLQKGQTIKQLKARAREIQKKIYPRELFITSVAVPKILWLDVEVQC